MDRTRIDTISQGIRRLNAINNNTRIGIRENAICIHFLGADEHECPSIVESDLEKNYEEIVGLLCEESKISKIHLCFIGPNLQVVDHTTNVKVDILGVHVQVTVHPGCYHEIYTKSDDISNAYLSTINIPDPDVVFMFNPGVWGYSTWLASFDVLHGISRSTSSNIYTIMTAYTIQEIEDDYDCIVAHFSGRGITSKVSPDEIQCDSQLYWFWECQENENCSSPIIHKTSVKETELYRDSQYWSCCSFYPH